MKFAIINGPNLNLLGLREPELYGTGTFKALEQFLLRVCEKEGVEAVLFQSNHEGALVDRIQQCYGSVDGIIINPAAYSHTSIALMDALKAVSLPAVEVHLTDIQSREEFRHHSYTASACLRTFSGLGFEGYRQAILYLKEYLENKNCGLHSAV